MHIVENHMGLSKERTPISVENTHIRFAFSSYTFLVVKFQNVQTYCPENIIYY